MKIRNYKRLFALLLVLTLIVGKIERFTPNWYSTFSGATNGVTAAPETLAPNVR